ncbi:MAG: hypothetical protein KJP06_00695 [Deltaproteobacteria bacterium]|nr:hypothetical protein [Deltaproteobacteria bacterium]
MKPIRFNPAKDLAPIPFDEQICRLASDLKNLGLNWRPHVGCFVWDPDGFIKAESPFPGRIYFILSLPRFVDIFGSIASMVEKLVWLPTWHQARLLCDQLGVTDHDLANEWHSDKTFLAGEDLLRLYRHIGHALQNPTTGDETP